jgi:hypothetical protein
MYDTWRLRRSTCLFPTMPSSPHLGRLTGLFSMCLTRRLYAGRSNSSEANENSWWTLPSIYQRIISHLVIRVVSPNREKFQKMPIALNFEIPYFTVSGFQVRYLKIQDKSGYHALPWVRYITQNGDYQIRMNWCIKQIIINVLWEARPGVSPSRRQWGASCWTMRTWM